MRDVLLTLLIAGLLPAILSMPHLGAYAWAWVSLMNPHRLSFGFASSLPFAQMIAIATILGALFSSKRHRLPINGITLAYAAFLLWMSVTSLCALNTPEIIRERWVFVTKIHFMMFLTLVLLRGRRQIETLVLVVTLSLAFFGVKGGIFTVITGGQYHVWGPPMSTVEGNNELAVALVMLIPFMVYFYRMAQRRAVRWFMVFSSLSCGLSILGSQSRGALLALASMAFFLGVKGKRPVVYTAMFAVLLGAGAMFMPDSWTSRMETIATYDQEQSAMARIYSWKTIWALALDRPIVGGGFATDTQEVYARYAPQGFDQFAGKYWVAHSIYFQALGEHGFPGLALYIALGVLTWRCAARLARITQADAEFGDWVPLLMRSVQVSLLGFAVGGAFLNLVHFDLPYYIIACVVLVDATVRERRRQPAAVNPSSMQSSMYGVLK